MICFNILYILSGNTEKELNYCFCTEKKNYQGASSETKIGKPVEKIVKSYWYKNMNENFKYHLSPLCSLNQHGMKYE